MPRKVYVEGRKTPVTVAGKGKLTFPTVRKPKGADRTARLARPRPIPGSRIRSRDEQI